MNYHIFLFTTFRQWLSSMWSGVKLFFCGLYIFICSIFGGLASLFLHVWKTLVKLVGIYPSLSLVVFISLLAVSVVTTYVTMRFKAVRAQDELDSLSYTFQLYRQTYSPPGDCDFVIMNGDTINIW